jgi:hypothetical protein
VTEKCELSSQSVEADEEFLHVFPLIVSCAGELSSESSELSRIWLYFFFLFGLKKQSPPLKRISSSSSETDEYKWQVIKKHVRKKSGTSSKEASGIIIISCETDA